MSTTVIPNTDNVEVACIAAALHLVESTAPADESFTSKLARFQEAYQVVAGRPAEEEAEVMVTLPIPEPVEPKLPPEPRPGQPTYTSF